jgi:pimeloyl-ACP methyl ester carboxylesterase
MPSVAINGALVSYRLDGSGPGMVLVHGTGGNSETNWAAMTEEFAKSHTVVRPDYSGSGDTTDQGGPLMLTQLAKQVAAAAEDAGAIPFDLVGFSLGAAVSIVVAAERPDLVRSLVLVSGFVSSADARQQAQFTLWRDLIRSDVHAMARLLLLSGFSPAFVSRMDHAQVADILEQIVRTMRWDGMARQVELDMEIDVTEYARRIHAPTLIVGCTQDQMVPIHHARAVADLIKGSRFVELDSGHVAPQERPEELAHLVRAFVTDGGDRGAL